MKNIFICGGAGFVGRHLVKRLLDMPGIEHITVFDNFSSGRHENVAGLPLKQVTVVTANARDYDNVRVSMAGADTVFHLAANPDIARAVREPTLDFDQGTMLTKNVLEAARVNGVQRIIYFSGSGVYGDRGDTWLSEGMVGNPISPYGAAKLASEAMLSAYCSMFGIRGLTFRMANIVGPHQTHGVGYDFIRRLNDDPTTLGVLGDGQQKKSYVYIDDVLNAVFGAINRQEVWADFPVYDVFNVSSSDWITVEEIALMAGNVMSGELGKTKIVYTGGARGWPGDVPVVRLNCSKIQSMGWKSLWSSVEAMHTSLVAMKGEICA